MEALIAASGDVSFFISIEEDLSLNDEGRTTKDEISMDAQRWNKTRISERLGIEYPIIQGPLGGLAAQKLTALVSNFGGLGSFGAHGLAPAAIEEVIAEIRTLTSRPFAINLWVSMEDEGAFTAGKEAFDRSLAPMAGHIEKLGGKLPGFVPYAPIRFEDQVRVVLEARVPVFSFICGIPPREILQECRAKAIVTMGTATTPEEAVALEHAGVDIVVASGFEAGGHRGSFLRPAEESLTGTFSLVPRVASLVDIPVVAAGGIADARGLVAAFALGAEGVQMGTAFLASEESGASPLHREAIRSDRASRTALTKAFTGRLARGIKNQLMDELGDPGVEVLPYPLQRALVRNLTALAEKEGRAEFTQMWAGQSASLSRSSNVVSFLQTLVLQVSSIAGAVLDWNKHWRASTSERPA